MKSLTFVMLMTSLLTSCVHVQAMISSSIVPMAASSSLEVPPVPEPSDLSQIIAIEDELPAEQGILVVDAETTGFSHEKLGAQAATGENTCPSSVDPRLYDFAAGLKASRAAGKKARQSRAQVEKTLQEALSREEEGARLDTTTPRDGHCLFHACVRGGLIQADSLPIRLTEQELRRMALNTASEEDIQSAADGTGQGMSIAT